MTAPEHEEAPAERQLDEGSENHLAAGLAQKATRIEDQTELPCPSWCQRDARHPFESHNPLTRRQSRPHSLVLASGEGVYVAVVQDDEREQGDDGTAVRRSPFVAVEIEGDLDAASLRRRAAEVLNAADRLDGITGDVRWTEDAL